MTNTFRFNSLSEFHNCFGLSHPEHPLVSVIDYSKVIYPTNEVELKWIQNFHSIGLKRNVNAKFNYGQQEYDFDSGVLTFISPLQFLKIEIIPEVVVEPSGWLLLIHPDFLWNHSLASKIKTFDFFEYAVSEALFLSDKEEKIIVDIMNSIQLEYQSNIDKFSHELIVSQIERLLIYAKLFYERQFFTREKSSNDLIKKFEGLLAQSFETDNLLKQGIPTVKSLADKLHISPTYLGNVLRMYTSQNTQQHIQNRMITYAKVRLSTSTVSASEIAYELGFEHPQSFSKLFKRKTMQTPIAFRKKFN